MTPGELKDALTDGRRVSVKIGTGGDITYERVSAVIYRMIDGRLTVCAELSDKNGRSVTVVRAQDVTTAKGEGK